MSIKNNCIIKGMKKNKFNFNNKIRLKIGAISVVLIMLIFTVWIYPTKESKIVATNNYVDYTISINSDNQTIKNSITGENIVSENISYSVVDSVHTLTLTDFVFNTSNARIIDFKASVDTPLRIVLNGNNILRTNYKDNSGDVYGIFNRCGSITFEGEGTLEIECGLGEGLTNARMCVVHAQSGDINIKSGNILAKAKGSNGRVIYPSKALNLSGGTLKIYSGENGTHKAINSKEFNMTGGELEIDVVGRNNKVVGIGSDNKTDIIGGKVNINLRTKLLSIVDLKALVKMYANDTTLNRGYSWDSLNKYIDEIVESQGIENVMQFVKYVYEEKTIKGTMTDKDNALCDIINKVRGRGVESGYVHIGNEAEVDITFDGINVVGIGSEGGSDETIDKGVHIDTKATIDIKGKGYATSINKYGFSGGIYAYDRDVVIDDAFINMSIKYNTIIVDKRICGIRTKKGGVTIINNSRVNIVADGGIAIDTEEEESSDVLSVLDAYVLLLGSEAAVNIANTLVLKADDGISCSKVINVSENVDGKERTAYDDSKITGNLHNYKYMEIGSVYDFTLYIGDDGNLYKNTKATENLIPDTLKSNMGITTSVEAGVVNVTFNNSYFVSNKEKAIVCETDTKIMCSKNSNNKIINAYEMGGIGIYTENDLVWDGYGNMIIDAMYIETPTATKRTHIQAKNIRFNRGGIVLQGIDNGSNISGIATTENVVIEGGNIDIVGGKNVGILTAIDATGAVTINGGYTKIDLDYEKNSIETNCEAHGIKGNIITISGGITSINMADANGNTTKREGVTSTSSITINNGTCEVNMQNFKATDKLYNVQPIIDSDFVAISDAKDNNSVSVATPDIIGVVGTYSYARIEPNYFIQYDVDNKKFLKSGSSTEININGLDIDEAGNIVMDGFNFTTCTASKHAFYIVTWSNKTLGLEIKDGSKNTLINHWLTDTDIYGIRTTYCVSLDIYGKGSLDITCNVNKESFGGYKYGIDIGANSTIKGTSIDIVLPDKNGNRAIGIRSGGNMAISDNCVIKTNEYADDGNSRGIQADGDMSIKNSKIMCISNTKNSSDTAVGIYGNKSVTLENIDADIQAYSNTDAEGIKAYKALSITDSKIDIDIKGKDNWSAGIRASSGGVVTLKDSYINMQLDYEEAADVNYGISTCDSNSNEDKIIIDGTMLDIDSLGSKYIGINSMNGSMTILNNSYIFMNHKDNVETSDEMSFIMCDDYGINIGNSYIEMNSNSANVVNGIKTDNGTNGNISISNTFIKIPTIVSSSFSAIYSEVNTSLEKSVVKLEDIQVDTESDLIYAKGIMNITNSTGISGKLISNHKEYYIGNEGTEDEYKEYDNDSCIIGSSLGVTITSSNVLFNVDAYAVKGIKVLDGVININKSGISIIGSADSFFGIFAEGEDATGSNIKESEIVMEVVSKTIDAQLTADVSEYTEAISTVGQNIVLDKVVTSLELSGNDEIYGVIGRGDLTVKNSSDIHIVVTGGSDCAGIKSCGGNINITGSKLNIEGTEQNIFMGIHSDTDDKDNWGNTIIEQSNISMHLDGYYMVGIYSNTLVGYSIINTKCNIYGIAKQMYAIMGGGNLEDCHINIDGQVNFYGGIISCIDTILKNNNIKINMDKTLEQGVAIDAEYCDMKIENCDIDITMDGNEEKAQMYMGIYAEQKLDIIDSEVYVDMKMNSGMGVIAKELVLQGGNILVKSKNIAFYKDADNTVTIDNSVDPNYGVILASTEYDGSVVCNYDPLSMAGYKYMMIGHKEDCEYIYYPTAGVIHAADSGTALTTEQLESLNVSIINDETANTLVLNSLNLNTSKEVGIWIIDSAYIELAEDSINNIISTSTSTETCAIKGTRNIVLDGNGSLNLNKTSANESDANYYGINVMNNIYIQENLVNLDQAKFKLNVQNSATVGNTYGLFGENVYFNYADASVEINEDNTTSYGVFADEEIIITDGQVEIKADKVTNVVPTYNYVGITYAQTSAGANAYPGVEANTLNYRYMLVQPNYYLYYNQTDGMMYRNEKSSLAKIAGWRTSTENGKNELILDGFYFVSNSSMGLRYPTATTTTIVADSENSIVINYYGTEKPRGIYASQDQIINGTGTLNVDVNNTFTGATYRAWIAKGICNQGTFYINNCTLNINVLGNNRAADIYSYGRTQIEGATLNLTSYGKEFTYNIYANNASNGAVTLKNTIINSTVGSNNGTSHAYALCTKGTIELDGVTANATLLGNGAYHNFYYANNSGNIKNSTITIESIGGIHRSLYAENNTLTIYNSTIGISTDAQEEDSGIIYCNDLSITNNSYVKINMESKENPKQYKCTNTNCNEMHYYNHIGIHANNISINTSKVDIDMNVTRGNGIYARGNLVMNNTHINEIITAQYDGLSGVFANGNVQMINKSSIIADIDVLNTELVEYSGEKHHAVSSAVVAANGSISVNDSKVDMKGNMGDGYGMRSSGGIILEKADVDINVKNDYLDAIFAYDDVVVSGGTIDMDIDRWTENATEKKVFQQMSSIFSYSNIIIRNKAVLNLDVDNDEAFVVHAYTGNIDIDDSTVIIKGDSRFIYGIESYMASVYIDNSNIDITDCTTDGFNGILATHPGYSEEQIAQGATYNGVVEIKSSTIKLGATKKSDDSYAKGIRCRYNDVSLLADENIEKINDIDMTFDVKTTSGIVAGDAISIEEGMVDIVDESSVTDSYVHGICAINGVSILGENTNINMKLNVKDEAVGICGGTGNVSISDNANLLIDACGANIAKGIYTEVDTASVNVDNSYVTIYAGNGVGIESTAAIAIDTSKLNVTGQKTYTDTKIIEASKVYKDKDADSYLESELIAYPADNNSSYKYIQIGDVANYGLYYDAVNGKMYRKYRIITDDPNAGTEEITPADIPGWRIEKESEKNVLVLDGLKHETLYERALSISGTDCYVRVEGENTIMNITDIDDGYSSGITFSGIYINASSISFKGTGTLNMMYRNESNVVYGRRSYFGVYIVTECSSTLFKDVTINILSDKVDRFVGVLSDYVDITDADINMDANVEYYTQPSYGILTYPSIVSKDKMLLNVLNSSIDIDIYSESIQSTVYGIEVYNLDKTNYPNCNVNIASSDIDINVRGNIVYGIYASVNSVDIENMNRLNITAQSINGAKTAWGIYASKIINVSNTYANIHAYGAKYAIYAGTPNIKGRTKISTKNFAAPISETDLNALSVVTDINTSARTNYRYVALEPSVLSVDITWGALNYEYEKGTWNTSSLKYDNQGWKTVDDNGNQVEDGDKVSVLNNSNVPVKASVSYTTAGTEHDSDIDVNVLSDKANSINGVYPQQVAVGDTMNAYITLIGNPTALFNKVVLGSVTITLSE